MGKLIDLTGQRFGKLTVIARDGSDKNNKATWLCRCDCGKETVVRGSDLRQEKIHSCGCIKTNLLSKNLIGQKFGKLTVLKQAGKINIEIICGYVLANVEEKLLFLLII